MVSNPAACVGYIFPSCLLMTLGSIVCFMNKSVIYSYATAFRQKGQRGN